jgi:hypothetical protein
MHRLLLEHLRVFRDASRLAKVDPLNDFLAFSSSAGEGASLRSWLEKESGGMVRRILLVRNFRKRVQAQEPL